MADGRWLLQPTGAATAAQGHERIIARTRPLSVLEVELEDGSREHGYVIERGGETNSSLVLQTGPEQQSVLAEDSLAYSFYPNDLSLIRRGQLALDRLKNRIPLSQTPSPR